MGEVKTKTFGSLSEQKEYIKALVKANKWVVRDIRDEQPRNKEFYGSYSLDETLKGMDYGFQTNTDYFLENLQQLDSDETGENIVKMDIEGFAYDMGAVISGEPECCVNMNTRGVGKTITINMDMNFSWQFTAEEINNRSIAVVKLINTLMSNGYIVNFYVSSFNKQNDLAVYYKTKIDTETINISTIAFISSVEYFRQIGWITVDVIRDRKSIPTRGNGFYESEEQKKRFTEGEGFFIPGFYYLDKYCPEYDLRKLKEELSTVDKATKHIEKLYNEFCSKQERKAA